MALKQIFFVTLILSIILILTSPAFGADIRDLYKDTHTEEEIQKIIDTASPTKPEVFSNYSKSNKENVLAVYGEIPVKKGGTEAYEWWLSISDTVISISNDQALGKYHYMNGGFITGYGPYSEGFITVKIDPEQRNKITEKDLSEIKNIVDQYAEKNGINNAPILIICEDIPRISSENESNKKDELSLIIAQTDLYNDSYRPIIGGTKITREFSNGSTNYATIGYAVRYVNNSSKTGVVTVAFDRLPACFDVSPNNIRLFYG
ncbi:hypothetical protein MsAg5_15430 [Methanosarcinaceae archaeon Ag5]|uniref:Uncharacterized protein n=1 Tax=Methanolapillus africanus TaxID=3028297 RepID=A0AAE4MKK5_9EURY|nr:hypothetical protein [Methanosarcinaceae archaeon Ag5]